MGGSPCRFAWTQVRGGCQEGPAHVFCCRQIENGAVKKEEEDQKPLLGQDATIDAGKMLQDVVEVAILGLKDDDDDVRAVAASALVPIVDVILKKLPGEVGRLLDQLWDCLGDLKDDLASSIGGVMDLLAKLIEHPGIVIHLRAEAEEQRALSLLIPRLFPSSVTRLRAFVFRCSTLYASSSQSPRCPKTGSTNAYCVCFSRIWSSKRSCQSVALALTLGATP